MSGLHDVYLQGIRRNTDILRVSVEDGIERVTPTLGVGDRLREASGVVCGEVCGAADVGDKVDGHAFDGSAAV